jgi:tetratricopeptide (TPR) repeat protein
MENAEYIESYFTNKFPAEQAEEFEKRIESDPDFAEEVAFYLSVHRVARELAETEKKEHFKKLYQSQSAEEQISVRKISTASPVRKLVYYISAAAVIAGIIYGTYTFTNTVSPQQLASRYEKENLQNLGVTMSTRADSIQTGISLYNDGRYQESLTHFETIIRSDTSSTDALRYAGCSALQLKQYDLALTWFKKLEKQSLFSNPGALLEALTLMLRSHPGDIDTAKELLQKIVANNLEGKETAQDWLKKL